MKRNNEIINNSLIVGCFVSFKVFCVCYFGGLTISDPEPCSITLYYSDFLIKGIKQPVILNKKYSFSVNITIMLGLVVPRRYTKYAYNVKWV